MLPAKPPHEAERPLPTPRRPIADGAGRGAGGAPLAGRGAGGAPLAWRRTFASVLLGLLGASATTEARGVPEDVPPCSLPSSPVAPQESTSPMTPSRRPIVIAHRGASAERPEHTLPAYRLAIEQGADFIEPDLVLTRDGHLIARHENELGSTTNVAALAAFADRRTTKRIDGVAVTGWFSEDFTLAEIRRLSARERIPSVRPANAAYDGTAGIPTLREIIALVREMEAEGHAPVGLYPETKHPTWFAEEGHYLDGTPIRQSISRRLVETLVEEDFTHPARVYIQSFEFANLIDLAERIMPAAGIRLPLIQLYGDLTNAASIGESSFSRPWDMVFNVRRGRDLEAIYGGLVTCLPRGINAAIHYGDLASPAVLKHIAGRYATGIGPWKDALLPVRSARADAARGGGSMLTGRVHPLLGDALATGLEVHPYTLRPETAFLARYPNGSLRRLTGEVVQLLGLGVTGVFTDAPAQTVRARSLFFRLSAGEGDAGSEARAGVGDPVGGDGAGEVPGRGEQTAEHGSQGAAVTVQGGMPPSEGATQASRAFDLGAFLRAQPGRFGPAVLTPAEHRVQVIYTQIDRDERNRPTFRSYRWRVDEGEYFYPASTVKLPVALLALETLARLDVPGLDRDTPMLTGAAHPSQSAVSEDPTAPTGLPSIAHYVRRIFAVSDNDAYNRLYEFLGQDAINARLREQGYAGARIVHRLSLPLGIDANRRTNPIRFLQNDRVLYVQGERVAQGDWRGHVPLPLGRAEVIDGKRVPGPKDFAAKNALPLQALHDMVQAVMFPDAVPAAQRFALTADDLAFVRRAMALTPRETGLAVYADRQAYPDGYVKFLLFGGDAGTIPPHLRIFNKVGEAYGFLTDAAYVVDFDAGVEFLLAATVYSNANGTFNDDQYEYETVGLPFLQELGRAIYEYELARRRPHSPDLEDLARLFLPE